MWLEEKPSHSNLHATWTFCWIASLTAIIHVCTSAVGFMGWMHRQCMRFAYGFISGTNEAQNETKTKPGESCVLQWLYLHALVCLCFLQYSLVLFSIRPQNQRDFYLKPYQNTLSRLKSSEGCWKRFWHSMILHGFIQFFPWACTGSALAVHAFRCAHGKGKGETINSHHWDLNSRCLAWQAGTYHTELLVYKLVGTKLLMFYLCTADASVSLSL